MNHPPISTRRAYFCGICGTAMGQVALLLRRLGWEIGGSDENAYPPMSHLLEQSGVRVDKEWSPAALEPWRDGIFVVGNALSRGNPQVEWLWSRPELAVHSLPTLIARVLLPQRPRLVVAGTHGKTTTAAAAAWLLQEAGLQPGYLVGGVPRNLHSGAEMGKAQGPFVIEGDEYDTAFFDKRSKFIHYRPSLLLLNNLEFDHADIFTDLADVERSFRALLQVVAPGGTILFNGDDPSLRRILPVNHARCLSFGADPSNDFQLKMAASMASVSIHSANTEATLTTCLWGEFNLRNLAGAWLACRLLQPEADISPEPLSRFTGVARRQEVLATGPDWVILEDFGHHPTAIAQTLRGLRHQYPGYRLVAAVEPRSNSMRRKVFEPSLGQALAEADTVILAPVHRADKLSLEMLFDPENLREPLEAAGKEFLCPADFAAVEVILREKLDRRSGPMAVCLFSNGAFGGLPGKLAQ